MIITAVWDDVKDCWYCIRCKRHLDYFNRLIKPFCPFCKKEIEIEL